MGSSSNKIGSGWKPMDNMVRSSPPAKHSQHKSTGLNGTLSRSKGRPPKLLSNGQTGMIQKHNGLSQKNNLKATMEQKQLLPQKKFNIVPIDKTAPNVKKESVQPTLPLRSTPTTMGTPNLNFQSASRDTGASDQNIENNITLNSNKDNSTSIEDELDDSVSMDKASIKKESPKNTRKLKRKITKLEAKLDGYKQNELLFRKNTGIITEEIYNNQFKIAKIYGQLATLKEKNENLNNFQDYLINDIINTKLDYEKLKQNLVNGITEKISSSEKTVQKQHTTKPYGNKMLLAIETGNKNESQKSKTSPTAALSGVTSSDAPATITTPIITNSSEPTSKSTSTIPIIPIESISPNKPSSGPTFNAINNTKENEDSIVTKANLSKLERGVLNRITEFEELERSLHNEIKNADETSQIIDISTTIESSYVKRLRNIIVTNNKDLRALHTILNNRTANFQLLLNKVEQEYTALKQKVFNEENGMKDYISKSQQYMAKASSQIVILEKEKEAASRFINELQSKLKQQSDTYTQKISLLRSNNVAALATLTKNNDNNANHAIYEQELKKKDAELKSSRNLYLSQQHTIELLSQELYNTKLELDATSAKKTTTKDGEVDEKVSKLLAKERERHNIEMQHMTKQFKQKIMVLKSDNALLSQKCAKGNTQKKDVIDFNSPEVKLMLLDERKKFAADIKSCLEIISKKSSLRDNINFQDLSSAINLLTMITTKLLNVDQKTSFKETQKPDPVFQSSMSPNGVYMTSFQTKPAQDPSSLQKKLIHGTSGIIGTDKYKPAPTTTPHRNKEDNTSKMLPEMLPFSYEQTIAADNSTSDLNTSPTGSNKNAPVVQHSGQVAAAPVVQHSGQEAAASTTTIPSQVSNATTVITTTKSEASMEAKISADNSPVTTSTLGPQQEEKQEGKAVEEDSNSKSISPSLPAQAPDQSS